MLAREAEHGFILVKGIPADAAVRLPLDMGFGHLDLWQLLKGTLGGWWWA